MMRKLCDITSLQAIAQAYLGCAGGLEASDAVLQCGETILRWETFERAIAYGDARDDMGLSVVDRARAEKWAELKRRYGLAIHISNKCLLWGKLSDLLWNTWDGESSDPRDKVFAGMGLVGTGYESGIQVDCAKDTRRVLKEVAKTIIKNERTLGLLLAARGVAHRDGLPSCVPDVRLYGPFWFPPFRF